MYYKENTPLKSATVSLKERRVKFTEKQLHSLDSLSEETGVPFSSLVRMAVNSFLPKTSNRGYTAKGIRTGYDEGMDK